MLRNGNKRYVLITAAKNEEKYIARAINAVVGQTVLPKRWVIVDDGSTDNTRDIVREYASVYEFISIIHLNAGTKANFGSQVRAINIGYGEVSSIGYDFIGNMDADVSFDSDYYERILRNFAADTQLGLAGGFIYEESNGRFESRKFNTVRSVAHAVHLFRRECFESIGGYIPLPFGGSDTVAEDMARMKGWKVRSFPEILVYHHRKTCGVEGVLKGGFRQGLMDYSIGCHPLFEILKCGARWKSSPLFLYAGLRLIGFLWASVKDDKRIVPVDFVRYLREEQLSRIRGFINLSNLRTK